MFLRQPKISIWVLDVTYYIYSMRVSTKGISYYWHHHARHSIPFCKRYEETVESFLLRFPELRDKVYTALNNKEHCYGGTEGIVNFYPESYKYDRVH